MGETLFDRVPWIYAFCREHLFRDDTERIVAHLWPSGIPPAGATVVELGCGPGFYARRLAAHDRAVVASGLDRSPAQVAEARQRAEREGLGNCRFELGDVAAMPYRDQSIDALVAARLFVLVEDREQVLGEMHRVLRPGGRLVIGVGAAPLLFSLAGVNAGFRRIQRGFLEWRGKQLTAPHFLDALTLTHLGDAEEPEETVWAGRGGRAAEVRRLVNDAGFQDSAVDWREQRAVFDTVEEFWVIQATWSSIARKRLLGASAGKVQALRDEFDRTCNQVLAGGGRLVYPLTAFYVTARRP